VSSAGIVLAAGASRRMGSPKQLLAVGGRPLLETVVAAACASSLDEVVVVLGATAAAVREAVEWGRARQLDNPRHAEGMSTSLQAGIAALGPEVRRCVVLLGDHAGLTAALIDALLDAQARSGLPAAALRVAGVLQPPVVLDRALWSEVDTLRGDVGLRDVLRADPRRVAVVDPAGAAPVDVDTPDDLRRLPPPST
jgi:molybdenum cofactor cytidylyltransferase